MFNNCLCEYIERDKKLKSYVVDKFVSIIEMSGWDCIDNSCDLHEKVDILSSIFPTSFVDRNPNKAEQIIKDLYYIAKSNIIRDSLPPLHTYAMYQMICGYEELQEEMGNEELSDYELERISYIRANYQDEDAQNIEFWFEDISEDFVDFYGDEFIWLDLWEYFFSSAIKNPEQITRTTIDIEEMLELMPNDIIYMWNKLKVERNIKLDKHFDNIFQKIMRFKKATESVYYVAFNVTPQPKEEIGRTLLQAYLNIKSYREVKMAAGQSDIFCPDENTIIETKIWRGMENFNDGLIELEEYLLSQDYSYGFYVLFYNTIKKPAAIKDNRDIFKVMTKRGTEICCVFVNIKPISPSKKNHSKRKQ